MKKHSIQILQQLKRTFDHMSDVHLNRISKIEHMLSEQGRDAFLLFALAKEYDAVGKEKKSIDLYEELLDSEPEYLGAYYHLAELLYRTDQIDLATTVAETGIVLAEKQKEDKDRLELIQLMESF